MAQKETTGQTISRLGVLTVLTENLLDENHLDKADRKRLTRERNAILEGKRGVPQEKVVMRTAERCLIGGAMLIVNDVGVWGLN